MKKMEDGLRKPDLLIFDGNKGEQLRIFKQECEIYIETMFIDNSQKAKAIILLAGREAIEVEHFFLYNDEAKDDDNDIVQ